MKSDNPQQASDTGNFDPFTWWTIVYTLFLIVGVIVVVASDAIQTYHVALTGYLSAGMVLTTVGVTSLVYSKEGAREAAAAGLILLSMVLIVWIFYFGSTPSATPRAFLDSFALSKESGGMHSQPMNGYGGTGRPETSNSVQPPQMYTSAQLNGFENSSPNPGSSHAAASGAGGPFGTVGTNASTAAAAGAAAVRTNSVSAPAGSKTGSNDDQVLPPTEYPYQAKAIYSYEANPSDANEISFNKHEILDVSDVSGRWWQARRRGTGEAGIAPSNYLILL